MFWRGRVIVFYLQIPAILVHCRFVFHSFIIMFTVLLLTVAVVFYLFWEIV